MTTKLAAPSGYHWKMINGSFWLLVGGPMAWISGRRDGHNWVVVFSGLDVACSSDIREAARQCVLFATEKQASRQRMRPAKDKAA
jgi:hypothetical protein